MTQGKGLTPNPKTPQKTYKAGLGITQPAPSIRPAVDKESKRQNDGKKPGRQ